MSVEEESVRKFSCQSVKWRANGQPPLSHELQHWLTSTLINISFAIALKLEQQSTEPENTNPKAEHTRNKTCSRRLAGSEEPRLSVGREKLLMPLLLRHLFPASPVSSQPWLLTPPGWGRTGSVHLPWTWRRCRISSTKAPCSNFGSRHLDRMKYHSLHLPDEETMTFETEMIKNHQEFQSLPSL